MAELGGATVCRLACTAGINLTLKLREFCQRLLAHGKRCFNAWIFPPRKDAKKKNRLWRQPLWLWWFLAVFGVEHRFENVFLFHCFNRMEATMLFWTGAFCRDVILSYYCPSFIQLVHSYIHSKTPSTPSRLSFCLNVNRAKYASPHIGCQEKISYTIMRAARTGSLYRSEHGAKIQHHGGKKMAEFPTSAFDRTKTVSNS